MLSRLLDRLSRDDAMRQRIAQLPAVQEMVDLFIAGETIAETTTRVADFVDKGLTATVMLLDGDDPVTEASAERATQIHLDLLAGLERAGLASSAEVSFKPSTLGLTLGRDGAHLALAHAQRIAERASAIGSRVTVHAEDHTLTDATFDLVAQLRADHPGTGVAVQARLRRTQSDLRDLIGAGSRVRLCKGGYLEPAGIAFTDPHAVDLSFVRCLRFLMEHDGHPMVATHDQRLIEITGALAKQTGRTSDSFEFQMMQGIRPLEQRRLVDVGQHCRVLMPHGTAWLPYLLRRLAERPADARLVVRQLLSRR